MVLPRARDREAMTTTVGCIARRCLARCRRAAAPRAKRAARLLPPHSEIGPQRQAKVVSLHDLKIFDVIVTGMRGSSSPLYVSLRSTTKPHLPGCAAPLYVSLRSVPRQSLMGSPGNFDAIFDAGDARPSWPWTVHAIKIFKL